MMFKHTMRVFGVIGLWGGLWTAALAEPAAQVPYRASFFHAQERAAAKDWATQFLVRIADGSSSKSFDAQGGRAALLSGAAGLLDLARLGLGVDPTGKPLSTTYWAKDANTFKAAALPTGLNGKVELGGRLSVQDVALLLRQYVKYGFFVQVHAPVVALKLDTFSQVNKGAETVNGVKIPDMINALPSILAEYGYAKVTTFKKTSISDVAALLGWQGYAKIGSEYIADIAGSFHVGFLLPVAGGADQNHPYAVSLGNQGHYGVTARGAAELGVFDWVALGASAGVSTFFKKHDTLRVRTHEDQSGWLRLGMGRVKVDLGSMWDVGAYARVSLLVRGLTGFLGYSFARQESTNLASHDNNLTVMLTKSVVDAIAPYGMKREVKASSLAADVDTVINADGRLAAWEIHTVHMGIRYCMSGPKSSLRPLVQFEYAYPFDGKNSVKLPLFAGTVGLMLQLMF